MRWSAVVVAGVGPRHRMRLLVPFSTAPALILTILLMGPIPGRAAPGAQVPITVDSARLLVSLGGSPDAETSGPLPLALPWSLSGICTGSGSVTIAVVDGRLRIDATGTVSGSACSNSIRLDNFAVGMSVPSLGESLTPVVISVESAITPSGGLTAPTPPVWSLGAPYDSVLLGGLVWTSSPSYAYLTNLSGGFAATNSIILDLVAGDEISFASVNANVISAGVSGPGGYALSVVLGASLPPTGGLAVVPVLGPIGRGTLAALLFGAAGGAFLARRRMGVAISEPRRLPSGWTPQRRRRGLGLGRSRSVKRR